VTREVVWDHGVSLPGHRLWLDPLVVRSFAFISHAHTDHARRHKEALLTPQTLALIPEGRRPRGWRMLGYREPMRRDQGTVTLYPAGHMLGSAQLLFEHQGATLLYTGDIKLRQPGGGPPTFVPRADVLIIETTRGDRELDPHFSRKAEEERFINGIESAFGTGRSVLVPVFALGKTQEILTMLHLAKRQGRLADVPIYIGGLSTKITIIHDQLASQSTRQHEGLQILDSIAPYVLSGREIQTTQINRNRIYALSSGMMTEKTLSNQLAGRFMNDSKQSIFFVGYADPKSAGGRLKAAQLGDSIQLEEDSPSQKLECAVREFDFSAHAPREYLLDYVRKVTPKVVVLVHGDPSAIAWFKEKISAELPSTTIVVPEPGREYEF